MAQRRPRKIDSIEALQKAVPVIVKAVNEDTALGLRAAANPLLAAEELGFQIAPELQRTAERRVRFSEETANHLGELEEKVFELSDERFDIDSSQAIDRVLFEKLKLPRPDNYPPAPTPPRPQIEQRPLSAALPPRAVGHGPVPDPLEVLRGAHPVMEPLLEYRQIEASTARLASRELYERIRSGEVKLPVTRIQARLKRSRTPK